MNKNRYYKKIVVAVYIIAVILVSWLFAAERAATCDYVSINGDFQSYNVFRRILDGQTPYVDFSNYIGMAPVFVNLPFVALKNTFSNSLFVTTFTSNIIFAVCVFMMMYLVTKQLEISCFVSAALAKVISTQILFRLLGPKYGWIFTERFKGLFTPSNSMRGTRSFLPFLIVIIGIAICAVYKHRTGRDIDWIDTFKSCKAVAVLGFILGVFIVWSNDYGVAAIASAFVIYIILQIFVYKFTPLQFAKRFFTMLAATAGGGGDCIGMTAVTAGHPGSYLASMAQTAQSQYFYFNGTGNVSIIKYIFTTEEMWVFIGIFLVFFGWALYRLIKGRADNSLLYLVFISLTVTAGTLVYVAGGSGFNCREPLEIYSMLMAAAFAVKFICSRFSKLGRLADYGAMLLLCAVAAFYVLQTVTFVPQSQGEYIEAFDGTSTQTKALLEAAEIVGDKQVFSTYATGLETVTGTFQPTGYDYIIHALGKETQEEYVQTFVEGEYPYVQTSSLVTESWISTQNWYFYRKMLPYYTKVFQTEYSWIWARCDSRYIDAQVDITVERINDGQIKIVCTSSNTEEFVADVQMSYSTKFNNLADRLLSLDRTAVIVTTGCVSGGEQSTLAMPGTSEEYIPVLMNNGYGEATVTAAYGNGIDLDISQVQFVSAMPALNYTDWA